jgi:hypothetical protein
MEMLFEHSHKCELTNQINVAGTVAAISADHDSWNRYWHIRGLILGFVFVDFSIDLLDSVLQLPRTAETLFFETLARLPEFLEKLMGHLQMKLTENLGQSSEQTLLRFFVRCAGYYTPSSLFESRSYTESIRRDKGTELQALCDFPAILTLEFRRQCFFEAVEVLRTAAVSISRLRQSGAGPHFRTGSNGSTALLRIAVTREATSLNSSDNLKQSRNPNFSFPCRSGSTERKELITAE